ncbi:hypothetical protein, partial [Enterococcus faecium]|uniref:hypothetical protein n=1 Tax=Enterococcus faecium TaxID=1352 RepID=UPI001C611771
RNRIDRKTIKDGEKMVAILAIKPAIFINKNCWFYSSFCFCEQSNMGPCCDILVAPQSPLFR